MSIVDTLANYGNAAYPMGVDWASQAQQYPTWQASIAAYRAGTGYGYFADLVQASQSVRLYMTSIGIDPMRATKSTYDDGVDATEANIALNRDMIEKALAAGNGVSTVLATPVIFSGMQLRAFLDGHMALLYTNYLLHQTGMIFQLGMTDQAIKDHADAVCRGYRQMKALADTGVLEPLRPAAGVTGLGDGGLSLGVGVLIGVGVLGALVILCAAIVLAGYLSASLVMAYMACNDLIASGNPSAEAFCEKALKPNMEIVKALDPMEKVKPLLDTLFFYGALGLGAYAVITFLPVIVSQVGESKRRWKEYA